MNINITIDARELNKYLKDTPDKLNRALSNVIQKAAEWVERESVLKTPRHYMPIGPSRVGKGLGDLGRSIHAEVRPMMAVIAPHMNYAIYVHEGTRYMRARPFMKWGLEVAARQFEGIVNSELKKVL
jgi:hypothetical protein